MFSLDSSLTAQDSLDYHIPYRKQQPSRKMSLPRPEVVGLGKRYPKLCLILSILLLFCMISWLPVISSRGKRNTAFVWPSNQTRDTRLLISPTTVTTIIQPKVCSGEGEMPYLLVVICSAVTNWAAREAIRNSWAHDQTSMKNVRVVFLLGQESNASQQAKVEKEAEHYKDIIQEGFRDSYANLTVKSLMLLKWFNQNCDKPSKSKSVEYVMKTDDDMYINLPKLYELVQSNKKPNLLVGSLICNAVPIKDPSNKWFVPPYMFTGKKFPNYLSGTGYLMHRSTVSKLLEASLDTPVFHLEDIYITGILSRKVGIRPSDNIGFSFSRRKFNSCLFRQTISTHHIKHNEMKAIYKKLQSTKSATCAVIKPKLLREYGPNKCKWT